MVDMIARRDEFSIVCGKCLWIVSESEAGWRILVGTEFHRKGAAELKDA